MTNEKYRARGPPPSYLCIRCKREAPALWKSCPTLKKRRGCYVQEWWSRRKKMERQLAKPKF